MSEPTASHRLFRRYLQEQGLPVTRQRMAVADVVFTSQEHLSVEEIEARLRERGERIGKATVYRTLDLLVRSRLVVERDFGEGFKRYEHRLSREPIHEHLICVECGKVVEFQSWEVQEVESRITALYGFRPVRHRLEVYGLCPACQARGAKLATDGVTCPIETV